MSDKQTETQAMKKEIEKIVDELNEEIAWNKVYTHMTPFDWKSGYVAGLTHCVDILLRAIWKEEKRK